MLASFGAIAVWLTAWLLLFPNIYGWLTDDIYQFRRVLMYETGGSNLFDIPWFHAYDWFVAALPWYFHWSIPSYAIPQAWDNTGHFRAFILYTIVLHAVILAMTAWLLRVLCANKAVAFAALAFFMTSPTFVFYSDLLDSRYMGLLAGLPALVILLKGYRTVDRSQPLYRSIFFFLLPGFLIGLGQSIHYTLTYFAGPISLVYWCYVLRGNFRSRAVWANAGYFVLGVALWFVPVQLLSLQYHPFAGSMLGIMFGQVSALRSPYDKLSDWATWLHFFLEDMGLPMMLLVAAGAVIAFRDRWRPTYISAFHARLLFWACAIAVAYVLITPSIAFYRQLSLYQIFFMLFAAIAIEVATQRLARFNAALRAGAFCLVCILAAWVPSIARMPEVFAASAGLGRAVNAAHAATRNRGRVYFIEFYDNNLDPRSLISRADLQRLKPGDVIVTDFPTLFFVKYPDLFALFHDTAPIASFPTEWCTIENWVEERTYWNFRRYQDEPESCNARVYSVAALRQSASGKPLAVAAVRSDSTMGPAFGTSWVLARRSPAVPMDMSKCCNAVPAVNDLWASAGNTRKHWLEIDFSRPVKLHAVTIVPANYFSPPGWDTVGRPQTVALYGIGSRRKSTVLWRSGDLRDRAIFTATFKPARLSGIRLDIEQPPPDDQRHAIMFDQRLSPSPVSGIEYIRFEGYSADSNNGGF
ncbi:MAG TPA: hypothetical protein VGZ02_04725 [Candidatus Baltobacteraceae bacterium]|nr:hypothetical protein [Candidatus Baltobacteraceae bacterium]